MQIKTWIEAARLRTLPLSLSGIILGSFIAYQEGYTNWTIFSLAILTTLFFQILSNFANDLGDSYKGADNEHRLGPIRGVQTGIITRKQMIIGICIVTFLSLCSAIPLLLIGTLGMHPTALWFYFILAIMCIIAAITYTVGKKAYGYNGLGDLMVFIFFGFVSVIGVYCLYTKHFNIQLVLPACAIGLLSTAVLNMNNMRDIENDKSVGKKTIVVFIGFEKAKIYHSFVIALSFISMLIFIILTKEILNFIALSPFLLLFKHLTKVWKTDKPQELDNELKLISLSTFGIAILFAVVSVI